MINSRSERAGLSRNRLALFRERERRKIYVQRLRFPCENIERKHFVNSRFDQIKLGAEENNAFMKFQRRNKEDVSDIEGAQPRYLPRARSQLNQYLISNDNQEDSLEKIVKQHRQEDRNKNKDRHFRAYSNLQTMKNSSLQSATEGTSKNLETLDLIRENKRINVTKTPAAGKQSYKQLNMYARQQLLEIIKTGEDKREYREVYRSPTYLSTLMFL